MDIHDHLFERRKYSRFHVHEGALAFISNRYGKIIDIGMQGLSFQYIVKANKPSLRHYLQTAKISLDITFNIHKFCLVDLPIAIIYDQEMRSNDVYRSLLSKRRCGVRFKDPTTNQLSLLKRFIILNQFGAQYV